jgi:hypothetical protein
MKGNKENKDGKLLELAVKKMVGDPLLSWLVLFILCFYLVAAWKADPHIGTWSLDAAKTCIGVFLGAFAARGKDKAGAETGVSRHHLRSRAPRLIRGKKRESRG